MTVRSGARTGTPHAAAPPICRRQQPKCNVNFGLLVVVSKEAQYGKDRAVRLGGQARQPERRRAGDLQIAAITSYLLV